MEIDYKRLINDINKSEYRKMLREKDIRERINWIINTLINLKDENLAYCEYETNKEHSSFIGNLSYQYNKPSKKRLRYISISNYKKDIIQYNTIFILDKGFDNFNIDYKIFNNYNDIKEFVFNYLNFYRNSPLLSKVFNMSNKYYNCKYYDYVTETLCKNDSNVYEHPIKGVILKENSKYSIDRDGNIYNIRTGCKRKLFKSSGYFRVSLDGKNYLIHRLVASNFIAEIPKGYIVNHKDGDKTNNNINNLEIITYSENSKHAISNGLKQNFKGAENNKEVEIIGSQWRICKEHNQYLISNKGQLYSLYTNKILKPNKRVDNYCYYSLKNKTYRAHRLVANNFIGEINKGYVVNHKDGIRDNNNVSNLEIITYSENSLHAIYELENNYGQRIDINFIEVFLKDTNIYKTYSSIASADNDIYGYSGPIQTLCNKGRYENSKVKIKLYYK